MQRLHLSTDQRDQFVDITRAVTDAVAALGMSEGAVLVSSPHTTAGIAVNEGYDPDVAADVLGWFAQIAPHLGAYRHAEGNSDSHIKAILTGNSQILPVVGGRLALGRWQAVFFCEFDGPREREVWITASQA